MKFAVLRNIFSFFTTETVLLSKVSGAEKDLALKDKGILINKKRNIISLLDEITLFENPNFICL